MKYLSVIIASVLLGAISSRAASVTFEAESGTLGADFAVSNSSSPAYITILSDGGTASFTDKSATNGSAFYRITLP